MPSTDIQESIVSTTMSTNVAFFILQIAVQNMSGEESKQVVIQLAEIMPLHILPCLTAQSMNLNHERVDGGGVLGGVSVDIVRESAVESAVERESVLWKACG